MLLPSKHTLAQLITELRLEPDAPQRLNEAARSVLRAIGPMFGDDPQLCLQYLAGSSPRQVQVYIGDELNEDVDLEMVVATMRALRSAAAAGRLSLDPMEQGRLAKLLQQEEETNESRVGMPMVSTDSQYIGKQLSLAKIKKIDPLSSDGAAGGSFDDINRKSRVSAGIKAPAVAGPVDLGRAASLSSTANQRVSNVDASKRKGAAAASREAAVPQDALFDQILRDRKRKSETYYYSVSAVMLGIGVFIIMVASNLLAEYPILRALISCFVTVTLCILYWVFRDFKMFKLVGAVIFFIVVGVAGWTWWVYESANRERRYWEAKYQTAQENLRMTQKVLSLYLQYEKKFPKQLNDLRDPVNFLQKMGTSDSVLRDPYSSSGLFFDYRLRREEGYVLRSRGPTNELMDPSNAEIGALLTPLPIRRLEVTYDPTNGLKSRGNIFRVSEDPQ